MFFIIQKRHEIESGKWNNAVITRETEDEALLQLYGYMFTYSHGKGDPALDYVSCAIQTIDGRITKNEIDNRMGMTETENAGEGE